MRPPKTQKTNQTQLFSSRLEQILNRKHPLFILAEQLDWSVFDADFGVLYSDKGRPEIPTRGMVGLWDGDRTNAILAGCGFNMAKLLRTIALLRSILGTAFRLNERNRTFLTDASGRLRRRTGFFRDD